MDIKELKSEKELKESYPVMHELRDNLSENEYLNLIKLMVNNGYRLFALIDSDQIVSLAGIQILTNFYYDKHIWIYDLVTKQSERSKGYGKNLLEFIESLAREENCKTVALSSGLERTDAHKFYEYHMNYGKPSYVFTKSI